MGIRPLIWGHETRRQLPIPKEQAVQFNEQDSFAQLAEVVTTCKAHRPVLHFWAAACGQLKLGSTANESKQEARAFFISLGLTVACRLLPVCGCFQASERSKWRMWFQTVSLQFSLERDLHWGTELVSVPECSRAVLSIHWNGMQVLFKNTVQNPPLGSPVALLCTSCVCLACPSH